MTPILMLARLALGPIIAGLVLWAANEMYGDRLLAGFIYALCCVLFILALALNWLAERTRSSSTDRAGSERIADSMLLTCVLVPLSYSSLPLPLVAAATVILIASWIGAYAGGARPVQIELGAWRTAAEMAGIVAFLAHQSAAILFAPQSIILGLDWAARILLWAAAALAFVSAAFHFAALRRDEVRRD